MTDYEKTEMATGSSTGAFRFFPVYFGFSRFSGKGTLGGVGCGARVGKDQWDESRAAGQQAGGGEFWEVFGD
jgi:hypothetical protein